MEVEKLNLTIELVAALVTVFAACVGIWTNMRNAQKATADERAKQAGDTTAMQNSLSHIQDDVKEIKADIKQLNALVTAHEIKLNEVVSKKAGG